MKLVRTILLGAVTLLPCLAADVSGNSILPRNTASALGDQDVVLAIQRGMHTRRLESIGVTMVDLQRAIFSSLACQTCGQSGFRIMLYTPEQWVAAQAKYAKDDYKPFTIDDVTEDMRGPYLHVIALPSTPDYITGGGMQFSSSVKRVVLQDTSRQTTIQPLDVKNDTIEKNSAFRSATFTSAAVMFDMAEVERIRATDQNGEFFVVVVGDKANKPFKVKDRYLKLWAKH